MRIILVDFPLKTTSELDAIEASLSLLEIILFLYDAFIQKKQGTDFLQFLLIFIDQIKQNISSSHFGGKTLSYWKGANSTAHWIKEQWMNDESSFIRNLITKRDSYLIHINYDIKSAHPQRILLTTYPELSGLFLKRVEKGWITKDMTTELNDVRINVELKKAFERIRKGWQADQ